MNITVRNLSLWVMVAFLAGFSTPVFAAEDAAAQQELLAAKKAELNGHEWDINLTSAADKSKSDTDTLVFKEMKFDSKAMTSQGFNSTNYTISLQEGGPTVWETMQSTESGNPVFWRGEWEGDSMKGVMSKQIGLQKFLSELD